MVGYFSNMGTINFQHKYQHFQRMQANDKEQMRTHLFLIV